MREERGGALHGTAVAREKSYDVCDGGGNVINNLKFKISSSIRKTDASDQTENQY